MYKSKYNRIPNNNAASQNAVETHIIFFLLAQGLRDDRKPQEATSHTARISATTPIPVWTNIVIETTLNGFSTTSCVSESNEGTITIKMETVFSTSATNIVFPCKNSFFLFATTRLTINRQKTII
ncbi:MAG TPA: hypothetical protein VIH48_02005 [Candidatus Bathyarchaeia archaeon]